MPSRFPIPLIIWWVCLGALPVLLRLFSKGLIEPGDGVMHYQIARFSWEYPELLLDHWGKPLFSLLASPFAQLGHWGTTLFNALCFVATAWAADGLLRKSGTLARWLFAPALLLVPVYGKMVLAGMTEVSFGLLTMFSVRALSKERYKLGAVIASLTPFVRPEYVVFLPCVMIWLALQRRYSAMPWLLAGHGLYALAGSMVLGDALWYFHNDPYTGARDIYGSGELFHFWKLRRHIFGSPLLWTLLLACVATIMLWRRSGTERPMLSLLNVLVWLPALGIVVLHSILWWKGLKGSLGLERVLATSAPLLVLAALWAPVRLSMMVALRGLMLAVVSSAFGVGYVTYAAMVFHREQAVPIRSDALQSFLDRVGDRLAVLSRSADRVVVFHPYLVYRAGLNPFDIKRVWSSWPVGGLMKGDLVVWDAHFGPNEGGLPLERLLHDEGFQLLEVMVPEERWEVLGGHPMEVLIFTPGDGARQKEERVLFKSGLLEDLPVAPRFDTIDCPSEGMKWCFRSNEFPFEMELPALDQGRMLYGEVIVTGEFAWLGEPSNNTELILSEDSPQGSLSYWSMRMADGPFEFSMRWPPRHGAVRRRLYFWNLSKVGFRLTNMQVRLVVERKRST